MGPNCTASAVSSQQAADLEGFQEVLRWQCFLGNPHFRTYLYPMHVTVHAAIPMIEPGRWKARCRALLLIRPSFAGTPLRSSPRRQLSPLKPTRRPTREQPCDKVGGSPHESTVRITRPFGCFTQCFGNEIDSDLQTLLLPPITPPAAKGRSFTALPTTPSLPTERYSHQRYWAVTPTGSS